MWLSNTYAMPSQSENVRKMQEKGKVMDEFIQRTSKRLEIPEDELYHLLTLLLTERDEQTSTGRTLLNLILTAKMQYSEEMADYRRRKEEERVRRAAHAERIRKELEAQTRQRDIELKKVRKERDHLRNELHALLGYVRQSPKGYLPDDTDNYDHIEMLVDENFIKRKLFSHKYVPTPKGRHATVDDMPVPQHLTDDWVKVMNRPLSNVIW